MISEYDLLKKFSIIAALVAFTLIFGIAKGQKDAPEFNYSIGKTVDGYFYAITQKDQLLIRQEYIPAVPGIQKIKTHEEARRIAKYIVNKLEKGEEPLISKNELRKLNITFEDNQY